MTRGLATRHPLASFLILACAISWTSGTLALHPAVGLPPALSVFFDYLAKFGPSLAALIVLALREGSPGPRRLLTRLTRWQDVSAGWFLLALFGPLCVWAVAAGTRFASGALEPEFDWSRALMFVPLLLKHTLIGGGLGEELGWRGFLLPALQRRHSALASAAVVGLIWGLWHLPAFVLPGAGKDGADLVSVVLFTLLTVVLSVLFTWVFNSTRGSLVIVVLLHGALNSTENALKGVIPILRGDGATAITYGLLLLGLAILVVLLTGPRMLTRHANGRVVASAGA